MPYNLFFPVRDSSHARRGKWKMIVLYAVIIELSGQELRERNSSQKTETEREKDPDPYLTMTHFQKCVQGRSRHSGVKLTHIERFAMSHVFCLVLSAI